MRKTDVTSKTGQPSEIAITDPVSDGIALKLRELYSGFENEGIPDTLLMLLDKLDEAERAYGNREK